VRAAEADVDAVSATVDVLGVQRLVDVSYELEGTYERTRLLR
jgi:hypothetical protein